MIIALQFPCCLNLYMFDGNDIGLPFLNQLTTGSGFPATSISSTTRSPSATVLGNRRRHITGGNTFSVLHTKRITAGKRAKGSGFWVVGSNSRENFHARRKLISDFQLLTRSMNEEDMQMPPPVWIAPMPITAIRRKDKMKIIQPTLVLNGKNTVKEEYNPLFYVNVLCEGEGR